MVLSSIVPVEENTIVGRMGDCVLMFSFNLHVFQKFDKFVVPYVGLSKPTLDGFCDGHKDFFSFI
jgi:hypothetical protein